MTNVKAKYFFDAHTISVGDGIINADGELWKVQRKAGLRFFSNSNLITFIDDVLPTLLADAEKVLDDAALQGVQMDLQKWLLELTTRFMGKVAYDVSLITLLSMNSLLYLSRHSSILKLT